MRKQKADGRRQSLKGTNSIAVATPLERISNNIDPERVGFNFMPGCAPSPQPVPVGEGCVKTNHLDACSVGFGHGTVMRKIHKTPKGSNSTLPGSSNLHHDNPVALPPAIESVPSGDAHRFLVRCPVGFTSGDLLCGRAVAGVRFNSRA